MAADTKVVTETSQLWSEKIEKFKDVFKSDALGNLLLRRHILYPLVISNCNGTGPWPFSDATIEYTKMKYTAFPVYFGYKDVFMQIASEMKRKTVFERHKKLAMQCLLDFVTCDLDKHIKCLKSLLTDKVSEVKVKTVLAIHYFQPLIHQSSYTIDKESLLTCECKKKVCNGDTSFGNRCVWHGMADIVLHKSVFKIATEALDNAEEESEDIEDLACESPPTKKRKTTDLNEEDNLSSIVEVEFEKSRKNKEKSQAIAQGIVNAFCEARRDKSLHNKFVPSFFVTEKNVRIILYNCALDVLLLSEKLPIWKETEDDYSLNTNTLLQVWLFLNFEKFETNIPGYLLENIPSSQFKDVVKNVYPIYLKKVSRPLEPLEHKSGKEKEHTEPKLDLNFFKHYRTDINDTEISLYTEIVAI